MEKTRINFSNGSSIVLNADMYIRPISYIQDGDTSYPVMQEPLPLHIHISYGLVPSILENIFQTEFFAIVSNDHYSVYNAKQIVSIETI